MNSSFDLKPEDQDDIIKEDRFDPKVESHCCPVCYGDYTKDELVIVECQHYLCTTCFYYYMSTAVKSGPRCVQTVCPMTKCNQLMPPSLFKKIVSEEDY